MVYSHYGNNDRQIRKVTIKYLKSQASVFPNGKAGAFCISKKNQIRGGESDVSVKPVGPAKRNAKPSATKTNIKN